MTVQHSDLTADADLHEPKGAAAAAADTAYIADGLGSGSFSTFTIPYDLAMAFGGVPGNAEEMFAVVAVRDITLAANLASSSGDIGISATATTLLDVLDDGVSIGTISISTVDVFTFTTQGGTAKTILAGSLVTIVNQATADATAGDIRVTLFGTTPRT